MAFLNRTWWSRAEKTRKPELRSIDLPRFTYTPLEQPGDIRLISLAAKKDKQTLEPLELHIESL
jgi:hypothetical protein